MKSNVPFLIELSKCEQIICIQEHWLHDYEQSTIENLIPIYSTFVRCWDINEKVTNFKARQGKGGVAIMWPKQWTQYIKWLDDGNERVIGIEVKASPNSVFINVYMPTKEINSQSNFHKHLAILHDMIARYRQLGTVIVCGDMNGTLIEDRNNGHDNSLKDFVKEHNLSWHKNEMGHKSTFTSHTGRGSSQIDYILCSNNSILMSTKIEDKHYLNQSAHTVVSSNVNVHLEGGLNVKKRKSESKSYVKINWGKVNPEKYQAILQSKVNSLHETQSVASGEKLEYISDSLKEAAFKVARSRMVKWGDLALRHHP